MSENEKQYDLEERTALFGENSVRLCKRVSRYSVSRRLADQLVRSATSIGANYMEANAASSRKDFRNKIHLCKKEAQETNHWLRMILVSNPDEDAAIRELKNEVEELILIFGKIISSLRE